MAIWQDLVSDYGIPVVATKAFDASLTNCAEPNYHKRGR